ncbi:hypothetical protein ACFWPU_01540 [Streptomyces sp. NPDC058471]|uniref:hypothetical protein n=1 Tax=Streptomyces sp. NPDC058471 TaxID=3346516 RepID=UPI00365A101F
MCPPRESHLGQQVFYGRGGPAAHGGVSPDYAIGDPVELPPPPGGGRLGLYDPQLRLRAGSGPGPATTPPDEPWPAR